ncbi:hypothetical protein Hanom_Chr13g01229711 [Helianthus anomalus]
MAVVIGCDKVVVVAVIGYDVVAVVIGCDVVVVTVIGYNGVVVEGFVNHQMLR